MKICILCEGSYPYVVGGVSSWVQQLVKLFPEHEFFIYAIAADESMKGDFRYELPENISFVQEVFLNDAYQEQPAHMQRTGEGKLQPWQVEAFTKLVMGEVEHWDSIFDFFLRQAMACRSVLDEQRFLFDHARYLSGASSDGSLFGIFMDNAFDVSYSFSHFE